MKNKINCLTCLNGAILLGNRNSVYILKLAINKDREINYKNKELGCRSLKNSKLSDECLKNNFCHYVSGKKYIEKFYE
jgi:hypothetical protein